MKTRRQTLIVLSLLGALSLSPLARASETIFGFQDDDLSNLRHFSSMAELGVKWVRTYLFWSDVEPVREDPPRFHWAKYDDLFKKLKEMGFTPIVIIAGNPSWISTYPGGPFDKGDMKDYLRFVRALAERYNGDGKNDAPASPKILYWEIYNEPDLTSLQYASYPVWGFWGNQPAEYANLLKAAYPVIKRSSPEAQVVLGGIALDNWTHFNSRFFDEVLKAGGGEFFDIMNFHYYYPFRTVWERYGPDIIGKTNYIRSRLASFGLRKEIICSEVGHWSGEDSSPAFQASYLAKLFARGMSADLKSMIWFILVDRDAKEINSTRGFFDTQMNKKPSYHVLKYLTSYMKGAVYRQPVSFMEEDDITINWSWKERIKQRVFPGSIVEGYGFYNSDLKKDFSVLWSNSREFQTKVYGRSIEVYDHHGKRKDSSRSTSNPLSIKLNSDPIFVEKDR